MKRNIDGIYMIVDRDGRHEAVCLSDMTKEELEESLKSKNSEWLKSALIHMALTLRAVGDAFDIYV